MKKIITAMVAAATLTMSASADVENVKHLCAGFGNGSSFMKTLNNNLRAQFNKQLSQLNEDKNRNVSGAVAVGRQQGELQFLEQQLKASGISSTLKITTSNGSEKTFEPMALVRAYERYLSYFMNKYEGSDDMFLNYFILLSKPTSYVYNASVYSHMNYYEKTAWYGAYNFKDIFNAFSLVLTNNEDPAYTQNEASYLDPTYQDFLYAILTNNYEKADEIVSNMNIAEQAEESGLSDNTYGGALHSLCFGHRSIL